MSNILTFNAPLHIHIYSLSLSLTLMKSCFDFGVWVKKKRRKNESSITLCAWDLDLYVSVLLLLGLGFSHFFFLSMDGHITRMESEDENRKKVYFFLCHSFIRLCCVYGDGERECCDDCVVLVLRRALK